MSLCLDSVRVMCVADHVVRLTGLLPTFLHTASNQKLEAREATLHSINFSDISDRPAWFHAICGCMDGQRPPVNRDYR